MKHHKKLNLIFIFSSVGCTYANTEGQEEEFLPYTTNKYKYTKTVYLWKEEPQTLPAKILSYILETHKAEPTVLERISQYLNVHTARNPAANKIISPIVVSDITTSDILNTGITRKKITQELNNDIIITITETWESQNPSYMTVINILLALSTFAAIPMGTHFTLLRVAKPILDEEHPDHAKWVKWYKDKMQQKNK